MFLHFFVVSGLCTGYGCLCDVGSHCIGGGSCALAEFYDLLLFLLARNVHGLDGSLEEVSEGKWWRAWGCVEEVSSCTVCGEGLQEILGVAEFGDMCYLFG
jgi:hypothetical protein